MKDRILYYRKKGNSTIIEGCEKSKSKFISTLPKPDDLLDGLDKIYEFLLRRARPEDLSDLKKLNLPSFLTHEKIKKNRQKLTRLDISSKNHKNSNQKVRR